MDQSQRRASGTNASETGRRLKLIAALAVTLLVAGIAASQLPVFGTATGIARSAGAACVASAAAETESHGNCRWLAAAKAVSSLLGGHATEPPVIVAESALRLESDNVPQVGSSERERHVARATAPDLHPGSTFAELCNPSADGSAIDCQMVRTRAKPSLGYHPASSESIPTFTISGRVLAAHDGSGIANVPVLAMRARTESDNSSAAPAAQRFRTITDTEGTYLLTGLPDGDYELSSGYIEPYQAARITAHTGVDYANIIVARNTLTIVEGQVLDADGSPLEGVTVLPVALGQPSVITANDGRFTLPLNLQAQVSDVTLRFRQPGYNETQHRIELVSVPADADNTTREAHVKVVLQPVETWTSLSGTVYSDAGEPLPARTVELRPATGPAQRTLTDAKGHYEFPVLESPANYHLFVYGGTSHKDHQQALRLTAATTELDITVAAYEFGTLTGQLRNIDGQPVPDFQLVVRNTGSRQPNAVVTSDSTGNFTIAAAPAGDLVMASQATPSLLVRGLHLAAGERLNLPLVIDWGQHELRGIVVDAQGNPLPASRIVLEWSHQTDDFTAHATRRTATDTQGQFAFSQLGPGPHSLRIDAPGYRTFALDHDPGRQGYAVTVRLN